MIFRFFFSMISEEISVSSLADFLEQLLEGQSHAGCVLVLGKPNAVSNQDFYDYAVEIVDTLTDKKYHKMRVSFIGKRLRFVSFENDKID